MPLGDAGAVLWDEAAAVVRHGEEQLVAVDRAGDRKGLRVPVANGVRHEFADDAQERVQGVVRDFRARHIEPEGEGGLAQVRLDGHANRFGDGRLVQGVVAQVPDAVAQLLAAGDERLRGDGQALVRAVGISVDEVLCGVNAH